MYLFPKSNIYRLDLSSSLKVPTGGGGTTVASMRPSTIVTSDNTFCCFISRITRSMAGSNTIPRSLRALIVH